MSVFGDSMTDSKRLIATFATAALLAGCQTKPNYNMTNVGERLEKTALSIEDSLRTLAAAQDQEPQHAINTDILVTPPGGMGGMASLDWSGPVEPLLDKLGHMTNYRVKVLGPIPPIPVIVTISARERVIADILKDAGLQAGKRANIVVYPKNRIIELRYLNA